MSDLREALEIELRRQGVDEFYSVASLAKTLAGIVPCEPAWRPRRRALTLLKGGES